MFAPQAPTLPEPPTPTDPRVISRWKATRQRRRLLYGCWEQDLHLRLKRAIGRIRKEAWGQPDLSSNVFRTAVAAMAVLYDRAPSVSGRAGAQVLIDEVTRSGLWSLMQRVQRDCLGLREMFVHVSVAQGDLVYRPVYPDLVVARATASRPDVPVYVAEAVLRTNAAGESVWSIEEYDLRGAEPVYRVLDANWKPVDEWAGDELRGEKYFWRKADGTPVIPYALYHASLTGQLFDPFEAQELIEGTLNVGVLWTMFAHVVRNASWPQRYVINAKIVGEHLSDDADDDATTGGGQRRQVIVDPSVVLELLAADPQAQVIAGQWAEGGDPAKLQEAIALYERRVSAAGGINPADVQRVAGDPRGGFAIAINRDAQRETCRRLEPQFRRGDTELLALSAIVWNRAMGQAVPEDGYTIAYAGVPASPEERKAEREHLLALLAEGLIDRVEVYMVLHPGLTEDQAEAELERIAGVNAQYAQMFKPKEAA